MSISPMLLRVRLAFGMYSVGYVFKSPPLPATLREELMGKGFLEVVDEKPAEPVLRKTAGPPAFHGKKGR